MLRDVSRLRAERLARRFGPDTPRAAMEEALALEQLSQDPDEITRIIDHAITLQSDPAVVGERIDPRSYVMTQATDTPAPSINGTSAVAVQRIPRDQFDAVRARLRHMRSHDPELTPSAARAEIEQAFGGELAPTGFQATFWNKTDPDEAEEEEEETEELDEDVDVEDEDEDEEAEDELEDELSAELQLILHDDGLRVVFDRVLPPARAYAVVAAIAHELGEPTARRTSTVGGGLLD